MLNENNALVDQITNIVSKGVEDKPSIEVVDNKLTEATKDLVSRKALEETVERLEKSNREAAEAMNGEIAFLKGKLEGANDSRIEMRKKGTLHTDFEKVEGNEGGNLHRAEFNLSKAFADAVDNSDVAGGRVDTIAPWYLLQQLNPYRGSATHRTTMSSTIKLNNIGSITFAEEGEGAGAGNPFGTNQTYTNRANGGNLESENLVISNWISQNAFSLVAEEDVSGLREMIKGLIMQE